MRHGGHRLGGSYWDSQRSDPNRLGFWYTTTMQKRAGKVESTTARGDALRRVDGFAKKESDEVAGMKKRA